MPNNNLMETRILSERLDVLHLRYVVMERWSEDLYLQLASLKAGIREAQRDASLEKVNMLLDHPAHRPGGFIPPVSRPSATILPRCAPATGTRDKILRRNP